MKMRYRWVIERYVGALLGDEVLYAGFGDFILKPRGQWHTSGTLAMSPPAFSRLFLPQDFGLTPIG
jgi:hypothetical protein